ncbi:arginine--tRNA ligase [Dermacoccus sp. Tok2021]|uniref:arginine--tRNA ligase n=1 Tax=Dermacoccus sp. Tok2021 TaxID=2826873 RepID=UPI001CA64B26|nr:arginine--tRNA ligase [Dermacoccus sp. Tok2021]MBZ4497757.1 arginine--tRNA ligase [Dermacoccus sp. Tok2021]
MADPIASLTGFVQNAIATSFGEEWRDADPVIRPANKKQTSADVQVNAAMALAKKVGKNPREVATAIVEALKADSAAMQLISDVEIAGPGFLNITLSTDWVAAQASTILADGTLGVLPPSKLEVIPLDYSSPNVAKEMHVGHLRTTVVGDSLARVLARLGHTVVRQNHVGDWGTPFGMLIEHLLEVGENSPEAELLETDPNAFYQAARVKFDTAEKAEPAGSKGDFNMRARKRVTLLQGGDPETLAHWNKLMDRSKAYFNRVYSTLGVTLTDADLAGESTYNDELAGICEDLESRGIARISDGALCIFQDEFTGRDDAPVPLIIRKSDGGYGYATTDLATVRHRSQDLLGDRLVYVVGAPQNLHFRMTWSAADKAGYIRPESTPIHVQIGSVLGADGKMLKTRSGDSVRLMELLDEAIERAEKVVAESKADMTDAERAVVARQVGIGAVKYSDLSVSHDSEYTFDFDRMLALTGNTGPYLQYAATRIRSILAKAADAGATPASAITIGEDAERALALKLLDYGTAVALVGETLEPHRLAAYLFELATAFTAFYEKCPVLKADDDAVRDSRLALCALTLQVLSDGLGLLGIETPEKM